MISSVTDESVLRANAIKSFFLHHRHCGQISQSVCQCFHQSVIYYLPVRQELLDNRTTRIRHQCRRTAVLICHRCLINTYVEKMNNIQIQNRTLATRCLYVRVNVGIQRIVYIFLKRAVSLQGAPRAQAFNLLANIQLGRENIFGTNSLAYSVK